MNQSKPNPVTSAGEEYAEAQKSLLADVKTLITELKIRLPHDMWNQLPDGFVLYQDGTLCNSNAFPSGTSLSDMRRSRQFVMLSVPTDTIEESHLAAFAELIRDGWLDKISRMLFERAALYQVADSTIQGWIGTEQR